jgi:hypothetical protein
VCEKYEICNMQYAICNMQYAKTKSHKKIVETIELTANKK